MLGCRSFGLWDDVEVVTTQPSPHLAQRQELVALFDASLGDVYGYLYARCGSQQVAEDLTSETFMAAAVQNDDTMEDDWDIRLDALRAHETLAALGAHHRGALTLRYLDGLPVAQVATHLDRTLHATEALLVRARRAFRTHYEQEDES